MWLRLGDHSAEMNQAIASCAAEHGGKTVGQPTVIARADATGQEFTSLEASGEWWVAYMRVRGREWVGPVAADTVKDLLARSRSPS